MRSACSYGSCQACGRPDGLFLSSGLVECQKGPWCGKPSGYTHHACRGPQCSLAEKEFKAKRYREGSPGRPKIKHGSRTLFDQQNCQCEVCTEARREDKRAKYRRQRE